MKRLIKVLSILVLAAVTVAVSGQVSAQEEPYEFVWKIPAQQWFFEGPLGVTIDRDDNVYVVGFGSK